MTTARLARASAARAEFVNLPRAAVWAGVLIVFFGAFTPHFLRASSADGLTPPRWAAAPVSAGGDFQLQLAIRAEPTDFLSPQPRPRGFRLREVIESRLPSVPPVRLGDDEAREGWDWAGFRRQLVRALAGVRRMRFEREGLCVESDRYYEPGRIPGVVQDAAIAAGVRAQLAGEPGLRVLPLEVQCREGCIRLRGSFAHCPETARAVIVALAVEGVREVRADWPVDLQREMAAGR